MSQPPLIISALDAQRLRNMLDSGAHDHMPGVDALSDEIDRATIVEPQQVPPDVVTMNSTVRFINDSTGVFIFFKRKWSWAYSILWLAAL